MMLTVRDPVGQDVQTPPCFAQNEQVHARARISDGSGCQSSANEILPQWQRPEINIGLPHPVRTTLYRKQRYATPLKIATRLGTVSFLNTTTIFGTPTDVTLSELALEMLFPADEDTVAIVKTMAAEEAGQLS